jgi:hypothetical protein
VVPVERHRQRMGPVGRQLELGNTWQVLPAPYPPEAEKLTALSSIEYPHWLMLAGALLLVLGVVGLAWGQRGLVEPHHNANEQEPPEPEDPDVDQVEVYNRTAKEKRRDRWAERFEAEEPDEKLGELSK